MRSVSTKKNWYGEFDLNGGALHELQLSNNWESEKFLALEALGSLCKLTLDAADIIHHNEDITQMFQASTQLQELSISLQGDSALESVEKTVKLWQGRTSPLQLTLLEYDQDNRGHVVARVVVRGHASVPRRDSNTDLQGSNAYLGHSQERARDTPATIEFLQWSSDYISTP